MGLLLTVMKTQLNTIHEVVLAVKAVVWDGISNFVDYFIQPWRNLFWFCLNIYVSLWSEIGSLTVKILLLPLRIYDAIQKEEMMEDELQKMRALHTEAKDKVRELECQFEQVLDESRRYKDLLEKADIEKRSVLKKFQVLQLRVMHLEEENDILKAREERALKGIHERNLLLVQHQNKGHNRSSCESECSIERVHEKAEVVLRTEYPPTPAFVQIGRKKAASPRDDKLGEQRDDKLGGAPGNIYLKKGVMSYRTKHDGWEAAILSSMFSVFLTSLVGMIAWEAQDPCVPLVVAVFMVVCMSLKTVAQFLLSIYNGPGFDAVALLSFNWFILGTLAHPVLPRIACSVAPYANKFGQWLLRVIGLAYPTEQLKIVFS